MLQPVALQKIEINESACLKTQSGFSVRRGINTKYTTFCAQ